MMARVLISLFVILFSVYLTEQADFLKQDFIDKINDQVTTWKAGVNFNPNTPKEDIVKLLGTKSLQGVRKNARQIQYKTFDKAQSLNWMPSHFDARDEWQKCWTIGAVRNQGNCGSDWAMSTSSAFADRLCIATDGEFSEQLSAEELTFCCSSCGSACNGGDPMQAWTYFKEHGLVTGGDYLSYVGCQPYRVKPCKSDIFGNNTCDGKPTEKRHMCVDFCYGDQEVEYEKTHRFTKDVYQLTYESIQKDVMMHGPVVVTMDIYDDFLSYKSGVYVKSRDAKHLGSHSMKLIGWGVENKVPFWLLVNSWGEGWGDEGLFRIRRGKNECGVDTGATAGVPETN